LDNDANNNTNHDQKQLANEHDKMKEDYKELKE